MAATLKTEQGDDDNKREYCLKEFDSADDKNKSLERSISDLETAIADAKDGIAATSEEIEALGASIKALDKSVAEATEQPGVPQDGISRRHCASRSASCRLFQDSQSISYSSRRHRLRGLAGCWPPGWTGWVG
jgi:septal ring factor EnvC (AmiA/AmiB activator)